MSVRPSAVLAAAVLLVSFALVVPVAHADSATPYRPPAPRPAMIAAGGDHTIAVTPSGTVRAWGDNVNGELGTGAPSHDEETPVTVIGFAGTVPLNHVVQVAAGDASSYALLADGTVAAWGKNQDGELGDNTRTDAARPRRVVSTSGSGVLHDVISVAAGSAEAYALLADHTVVAWGYGEDGNLGDGQMVSSSRPVVVRGENSSVLTGVVALTADYGCAFAVTSAGTAYAWGNGGDGELGDNDGANQSTPVEVAGVGGQGRLSHIVSLAGGDGWAMALLSDGSVVAWGNSDEGELGSGGTDSSRVPLPVSVIGHHIAAIGAGPDSDVGFAVGANGAVFGWGYNQLGQLGDGTYVERNSPVRLTALGAGSGVLQIVGGGDVSVAVTGSGTVFTWGANFYGQLGDGNGTESPLPTQPYALGAIGLPRLFLLEAPVLSGSANVGHTLSVTPGTWGLPATSHAYQWLRDGKAIRNATKASYRLVTADRRHHVSVRVYAGRAGYPGNGTTTRSVTVR